MATLYTVEPGVMLRETSQGVGILRRDAPGETYSPENESHEVEPGVRISRHGAGLALDGSPEAVDGFLLRAGIREAGREIY